MRFLIDAQLPPALARLLNERGHVAEHVNDILRGAAPDREWAYAAENDAVIVRVAKVWAKKKVRNRDGA